MLVSAPRLDHLIRNSIVIWPGLSKVAHWTENGSGLRTVYSKRQSPLICETHTSTSAAFDA